MISRIILKHMVQRFKSFTPEFRLTSGIVAVIIVSFVLFTVTTYFGLSEDVFSLGTTVFGNGHVHKLITYSFHHKTVTQLLLSIGVLVPLCGGIEKSVGTVRFLLMFLLLSISTGVLYTILGLLLFGASAQNQVEGFIPVSLSLMGMATVHSRMVKGFLFGVTVPMLALPWLFLFIITLLVPHTVFLCNAIAIIAGGIYGKGWLSLLDMSDARVSVLDKKMPFRLLRNIGVLYVPASTEERRKTVHPPIIPTPGSYPVQAYAPVSFTSNLQATETTPKTFEGWANSYYTQGSPVQLSGYNGHNHGYGLKHSFGPSHGHSHEHGHSCSHSQGHGHSHEHSFGHGLSHGHASASQTSSHWAPVAQHPHSQHSHLSPLSVSVSAPQSFTAKMPESLPESVMVSRLSVDVVWNQAQDTQRLRTNVFSEDKKNKPNMAKYNLAGKRTLRTPLTYNPFMQETFEKQSDNFQSVTPTLAGYLTNTSTNGSLDMTDLSSDCSELFNRGERASGVYAIKPNQSEPFMVYCDMGEDGGAAIIQRRKDGSVNFDQNWEKYENGFGDFQGEFWLGLRKIHSLASQGESFLNIQLEDWKKGKRFIEYNFSLDGPEAHYRIHLSQASGNLPDAMSNHTGVKFSTKDRDNDNLEDSHCAYTYTGGWWFNACGDTNLNGKYIHVRPKGRSERRRGIHWMPTRGASYSLRSTQISIRSTPAATSTSTSSETGNFSSEQTQDIYLCTETRH